jgi:hypothetical protein
VKTPSGYILYKGPSLLDGNPIVVIATTRSENRKTGDMVQTWILREDISPVEASKQSADASICGDCKHRWSLGGACYVNIGQGPGSIYRAYKRGNYPDSTQAADPLAAIAMHGFKRKVRLGAYGDPAAVPAAVWQALTRYADGHTGYTHQWRTTTQAGLQSLCMASVDNDEEYREAQSLGWRTFRVRCQDDPLNAREFECVADTKGTSCADCLACDGAQRGNKQASVSIVVHGSLKSRFRK